MTGQAPTRPADADAGDRPAPLRVLDGAALRRWAHLVSARLGEARAELDALNVFPVPDGDTGTNLHLTVRGAVADGGEDLARALLVHARGNSGVIASQLVRGWADVLTLPGRDPREGVDAAGVAKALRRGDDLAWAAVTDPVEGTVLSVSRAAADEAERSASGGAGLAVLVDAVVAAAERALDRTPLQLPALAAAGVVDAGGAGLVVALQALRDVVHGADGRPGRGAGPTSGSAGGPAVQAHGRGAGEPSATTLLDHVGGDLSRRGVAGSDLDPAGPAYEVMYLLGTEPSDEAEGGGDGPGERLRDRLQALGDSVLVVGGAGLWHAHVHTDDPGAAVEAGLTVGVPRSIRITHFAAAAAAARDEVPPAGSAVGPTPTRAGTAGRAALAVVACAGGAATAALCRQAGAVVVPSAPGERASTGDVLRAVLRAGADADRVLVLPNDAETAAVAQQAALAAQEQGVTAVLGRSRSQVQVLAALAVLGAGAPAGADAAAALASAAAAVDGCRHGAVAVAARDSATAVGPCRAGELVGTVAGDVVAVGAEPVAVAVAVAAALGAGSAELVTVLPGADAGPDLVQRVVAALRPPLDGDGATGPRVDVLGGGQPRYLLLLGCE